MSIGIEATRKAGGTVVWMLITQPELGLSLSGRRATAPMTGSSIPRRSSSFVASSSRTWSRAARVRAGCGSPVTFGPTGSRRPRRSNSSRGVCDGRWTRRANRGVSRDQRERHVPLFGRDFMDTVAAYGSTQVSTVTQAQPEGRTQPRPP